MRPTCLSFFIVLHIALITVAGLQNNAGEKTKIVNDYHKPVNPRNFGERKNLAPEEQSAGAASKGGNSKAAGTRPHPEQHKDNEILSGAELKITGGEPSTPGEYIYQVSIQVMDLFGNSHICGGAIITESYVLTVAQCVVSQTESNLQVVAGDYSLSDTTGFEQVRSVESITIHPTYDFEQPQKNDIAIIKVPTPFAFGSMVGNILIALEDVHIGDECVTTGWGSTSDSGSYSDILLEVGAVVLNDTQCSAVYGDDYSPDAMLCAGDLVEGRDFCQGDEGGPLNCGNLLQGLASWGVGCGRGNPGVYTRLHNFTQWIEEVVESS